MQKLSQVSSDPEPIPRRHILNVVVEDYCHVGSVSGVIPARYWNRFESRVEENTAKTLNLLDEVNARGTFFVLGWTAERQPDVVREIIRRGHEVASKGYIHRSLSEMTRDEFRDDAARSRDVIEAAAGVAVRGYRLARGGIGKRNMWALDVLSDLGFSYDSSVRPVGVQFANEPYRRFIHLHENQGRRIWEIPLSTWKFGAFCVPISGGNYIRQFPYRFIRRAIEQWDARETAPFVLYFHVWELDVDQPRITAAPRLHRVRQYRNLDAMGDRVLYLLEHYRFGTIADYLELPPPPLVEAKVPTATANASVELRAGSAPRIPITVCVPCYNEEQALGYLSNTLRDFGQMMADAFDVTYLFVDDGSKDKTWFRLNELFGKRSDCILVQHPRNRGVAAATMTAIRSSNTDIVCVIDCDTTYDPQQLRPMVAMLAPGVDLVTASPYHRNGRVLNLPGWRLFLSKSVSVIYRLLLSNKLATYTSCFRVYRRRAAMDIQLRNEGYVGIIEILSRMDAKGLKIAEYPAIMEVRLLGASKMKVLKTIWGHLKYLGQLVNERRHSFLNTKSRLFEEKLSDASGSNPPGSHNQPTL